MEYIYLLIECELIKSRKNIFKVGRTSQYKFMRFNTYPRGSRLLLYKICSDSVECEKTILTLFKQKYVQVKTLGREYFYGEYLDMMKDIEYVINTKFNPILFNNILADTNQNVDNSSDGYEINLSGNIVNVSKEVYSRYENTYVGCDNIYTISNLEILVGKEINLDEFMIACKKCFIFQSHNKSLKDGWYGFYSNGIKYIGFNVDQFDIWTYTINGYVVSLKQFLQENLSGDMNIIISEDQKSLIQYKIQNLDSFCDPNKITDNNDEAMKIEDIYSEPTPVKDNQSNAGNIEEKINKNNGSPCEKICIDLRNISHILYQNNDVDLEKRFLNFIKPEFQSTITTQLIEKYCHTKDSCGKTTSDLLQNYYYEIFSVDNMDQSTKDKKNLINYISDKLGIKNTFDEISHIRREDLIKLYHDISDNYIIHDNQLMSKFNYVRHIFGIPKRIDTDVEDMNKIPKSFLNFLNRSIFPRWTGCTILSLSVFRGKHTKGDTFKLVINPTCKEIYKFLSFV